MPFPGAKYLSVGVRQIDAGTEGLCFLMAHLFEPLVECRRAHSLCARTRCTKIAALMKFARRNFVGEERLMDEAGYPYAEEHRRGHSKLLDQLGDMHGANVCADRDSGAVHDAIVHWIADHIPDCDRGLGNWVVTRRVETDL